MAHFDVSPAAAHELLPACRLLFPAGGADLCCARVRADGGAAGLFVARGSDGRLCAAALGQVLSGALGVMALPRGDSALAREAVTAPTCAWLRRCGVKVCQAFAATSEVPDVLPLTSHGFRSVTQLVFLQRGVETPVDVPAAPLRWRPWGDEPTPEQRELLLATHEGTLDCPELNDARTADEILAGFRPNNVANRMWWSALDETGKLVGVVFLQGGEGEALELSYLGLVPAARRRGLASALVRFAARAAATAGYLALGLSVDVRNAPAMNLYARHAFTEYDRREVWLASWPR